MQPLKEPPFSEILHKNESVGARSGINLSINGTRKPAAMLSSRVLFKDLLQYLAIAANFGAGGHGSEKVDGGERCVQLPALNWTKNFYFRPGHIAALRNFCRALSEVRGREES